jgi:uncharacterized protein YhaN
VKIKSIQASSFGCLQDWEIEDLDTNLVVIYGHNEAGKSTFFHLIETLFYGWRPVKNNPYLPWEGNAASIATRLVQQNGEEIIVQRSLRNQAQGEAIKGQTSFNLRNKSLEMLAFLPRDIFSEVYFLTLEQLRFPDASAWQELQDQLLGGQYTSFLKPVSDVITDLEDEANSLWRPDRRGKPVAKLLHKQILELTQRRKKASENEQNLRDKEQQLFNLCQAQEENKEKRIQLLADLNRAERLLPAKKKLQRIAELRSAVGKIEIADKLPGDPQKSLEKIEDNLQIVEEKMEKTKEKKKLFRDQVASFGEIEQLFMAQTDEIGEITKAYSLIASDRQEVSTLQGDLQQNRQRLVDYANTFLLGGWKPELEVDFKEIDEVELQAGIAFFKEVQSKYQNKASQLEGLRGQIGGNNLRLLPPIAIAFFFLGILGILWLGNSPLGFASSLLLILGLGLGVYGVLARGKKFKENEFKIAEREVAELKVEEQQKRDKVKAVLRGLPVTEQRLKTPDETLWLDVKNMKIFLTQKADLTEKLRQVEERLQGYENRINMLLEMLKHTSSGDVLADLRILEKCLTTARECQTKAEHAVSNLREVEEQLAELQSKKEKLVEEKKFLLANIESLPGENIQEKIDNLLLWRDYSQQAQTLRQDLEREYPDLRDIEREIVEAEAREEMWLFSDHDLAAKKIALSEVEEQGADLKEERARLETELKHLAEQERIDDLTGAIQQLQVERKLVYVKRDRLVFLRNLIKEADRSFREKHQPDVLQKAGYYLEKITAGRYDRLFVQDDGRGLMVRSNYTDQLLQANFPLSRGTLEQIYLALRLALVEHLDVGREVVPLFLDEVLVNWDGVRLQKGLEILQELAGKRQVFVFTCHDWLVKKIQRMREVKVVELN